MKSLLIIISVLGALFAQETDTLKTVEVTGSEGSVTIKIPQDTVKEETAAAKPKIFAFEKGTQVVSLGTAFAFGSYYSGAFGGVVNYDHALSDHISLGAGVTSYFRDGGDEILVIPSGRLGFHFLSVEPLRKFPVSSWFDLYAVVDMGARVYYQNGEYDTKFNFGVPIGVRAYFSSRFGLQIESDWNDMMLSLAFRF